MDAAKETSKKGDATPGAAKTVVNPQETANEEESAPPSPTRKNGRRVHFHTSTKTEDQAMTEDPFGVTIPGRVKLGKGAAAPLRDAFFLFAFVGFLMYCSLTLEPPDDGKERKKTPIQAGIALNKIQKDMERMMMESVESSRRKEACDVFTEKGSIPDTGLGLFAGRRFVKGEVIYRPTFTVPLPLDDGSTAQLSPISLLIKFHPTISNVEGEVLLSTDGSIESLELRTTRALRSGEELFLLYEQHPLHLLSLHHRPLFQSIPLASDYATAEDIQSEIAGAARRMEVAHQRRVQDSIRINTGYIYNLGAAVTKYFAPNVAKLLPSTRVELKDRKDLPLPLAALANKTLSSLQMRGSCFSDVRQENVEDKLAIVASRSVANQALLQSVPVHVSRLDTAEDPHAKCFSSTDVGLTVCPLTDIALAPSGSAQESNVALRWPGTNRIQTFLDAHHSETSSGTLALDLVATKAIEKGDSVSLNELLHVSCDLLCQIFLTLINQMLACCSLERNI